MYAPIIGLLFLNVLLFCVKSEDDFLCDDCLGLIVDTDCGADDAMAISLLLKAEAMGQQSSWGKVLGITTVTGNTGAANVTRNVNYLLDFFNRPNVQVYQGSEDGLASHIPPTWFFGYDGFGDFLPYTPTESLSSSTMNPALYIANMVQRYPNRITLLFIGPLTNLALALHFNPSLVEEVKHIFILGGNYRGGGNVSPGIEANMYSDPDAAAYFFSSISRSSPITNVTLLPLETILDISFPMSYRTDVLGAYNSSLMRLLNKAEALGLSQYGDSWACYDPTAAAALLDDALIDDEIPAFVTVVNQGPRGAMFAQLNSKTSNVNIATRINQNRLRQILHDYLS